MMQRGDEVDAHPVQTPVLLGSVSVIGSDGPLRPAVVPFTSTTHRIPNRIVSQVWTNMMSDESSFLYSVSAFWNSWSDWDSILSDLSYRPSDH